ncbi:MAG: tetratricopeptide repeat protein [Bacteroidota bacterium]
MPTDDSPRLGTEADGPGASPDAPTELSPGRKRAFTLAMLLLPVLFFALLEGGLRLFGYGDSYPLFTEVDGAEDLLMPSREVATRYFTQQASVPTPNPDFFPKEKAEGKFRIVAQGGSSAAGYPFYRGASFPQVLGTRLRLAYPDREIEVINTAMAAVNSYTLLDFADEILEVEPDAVVIYAGHNEFYGALGAASTESLGRNPSVVRTYLALQDWRTVQLIRGIASGIAGLFAEREAGERPSSTLMARMIGEQSVPLGGEIYTAGLRQFESNLDRLLARYAEAGVPVYISTLASNIRDQRPFITDTEGTEAWQAAAQAGIDSLQARSPRAAIPLLEQAIALDSLAADPHFALGRSHLLLGDAEAARAALERARDLDALRFRAPTAFNRVIRTAAEAHGATVVDGEQALRDASPGGLIGRAMMLEHLHPTLDGYSVLADAFFGAMVEASLVGPAPRATPPGRLVRLVTPMDSLAGLVRVDQLTRSWPFRPEEAQPLALDSARTPPYVLDFARAVIGGRSWLPTADSLAGVYEAQGRVRDALTTRRAIVQGYPFLPGAWSGLASLELQRAQASGDNSRVPYIAGLYEQALERDPTHVAALAPLGALALQAGDRETALSYLERARTADPRQPQVLYNLSGAYMMSGRMDEAIATAEALVLLAPQNPEYQTLLQGLRRDAASR